MTNFIKEIVAVILMGIGWVLSQTTERLIFMIAGDSPKLVDLLKQSVVLRNVLSLVLLIVIARSLWWLLSNAQKFKKLENEFWQKTFGADAYTVKRKWIRRWFRNRGLILTSYKPRTEADFRNSLTLIREQTGHDFVDVKVERGKATFLFDPMKGNRVTFNSLQHDQGPFKAKIGVAFFADVILDLVNATFICVFGRMGAGKTTVVLALIGSLQKFHPHMKLLWAGVKGKVGLDVLGPSVDASVFRTTKLEHLELLDRALGQWEAYLDQTSQELESYKVDHIKDHPEFGHTLDIRVLVLDDANLWLSKSSIDPSHLDVTKSILRKVNRFAREGRYCGIIVVLCSQGQDTSEVDVKIKTAHVIITGTVQSTVMSKELFGDERGVAEHLHSGRMLVKDQVGIREFQVASTNAEGGPK
jgi:energy-coupling factor transporter ATP-binding protein EcfA2